MTSQGALGQSYVILRDGAAVVTNFDEQGRLRPRNYLHRGQHYGATSLLEGRPRDVTVRAVDGAGDGRVPGLRGADVLTLDRRDLSTPLRNGADLWKRDIDMYENSNKRRRKISAATRGKGKMRPTSGTAAVTSGGCFDRCWRWPLLAICSCGVGRGPANALRPAALVVWLICSWFWGYRLVSHRQLL